MDCDIKLPRRAGQKTVKNVSWRRQRQQLHWLGTEEDFGQAGCEAWAGFRNGGYRSNLYGKMSENTMKASSRLFTITTTTIASTGAASVVISSGVVPDELVSSRLFSLTTCRILL
ncbi:hypothetical protein R3P38DRAFT_3354867 [Favolaschia claudopus]|uniref:Uncharacterized protein n=1 Tax=Favolaschia claudopus TaxID=2862362 RepID=A0AAW0BLT5_9AGAR